MDVVETVPIPVAPDATQKTITASAVVAPDPALFKNPDREDAPKDGQGKRRARRDKPQAEDAKPETEDDSDLGLRINIRA